MNSGRQQLWVLAAACITLLLLSWAAFNASANGCGSLCRCEEVSSKEDTGRVRLLYPYLFFTLFFSASVLGRRSFLSRLSAAARRCRDAKLSSQIATGEGRGCHWRHMEAVPSLPNNNNNGRGERTACPYSSRGDGGSSRRGRVCAYVG